MSYAYFQKKNPSWPKRMADLDGRRVRVRKEIKSHTDTFPIGAIMRVDSSYRGTLALSVDGTPLGKPLWVTGVHPSYVELLP